MNLTTLSTLEDLEEEMDRAGRSREKEALHEALTALVRPERGFLTTGRAADILGISIPTVKRWIERGTLAGGAVGGRWVVSQESVERLGRLRESLLALDQEGNPTPEEVHELTRRSSKDQRGTASSG